MRKLVRKNGMEFEADILALCSKEKMVFIFEIKSNPDYTEAINIFKKKIERAHKFLDEIKGYTLYPIYGGLSMRESTEQMLTKEGMFAIILKAICSTFRILTK